MLSFLLYFILNLYSLTLSIFLGYVNVYLAYVSWIILPNLVAVWGGYKRRHLRAIVMSESSPHNKKKARKSIP